jgi:hypothetical protein
MILIIEDFGVRWRVFTILYMFSIPCMILIIKDIAVSQEAIYHSLQELHYREY